VEAEEERETEGERGGLPGSSASKGAQPAVCPAWQRGIKGEGGGGSGRGGPWLGRA
jgi:hypothetical protein